ncbi:serine/threonine-protein kinase [Planobispora longispora]|uniref:serine/threonine-protein kinase n=1 Tax=Planobispora longispora TaxID=28887 RepID=UPI0035EFABB0
MATGEGELPREHYVNQPGVGGLRAGDPEQIGPYRLLGRLGEGGMGTVYLALAPTGRPVAVKVVKAEFAIEEGFAARFHAEVDNARRVASFCTAQVLDNGNADDGRPYMVTEYIAGTPLSRQITEHGALEPGPLHGVALGVAAALAAIHVAGLVHRDLKPANVILSMSGPRVIDFGIARALDATSGFTKSGEVLGSPGWWAPEQVRGQEITPAADVFAWGCMVAYAGNGRHPYGRGDILTMATRLLNSPPDLGALPAPLNDLARRATTMDPYQRPTAQDLLIALVGGGIAAPSPSPAVERPAPTLVATDLISGSWEPPPNIEADSTQTLGAIGSLGTETTPPPYPWTTGPSSVPPGAASTVPPRTGASRPAPATAPEPASSPEPGLSPRETPPTGGAPARETSAYGAPPRETSTRETSAHGAPPRETPARGTPAPGTFSVSGAFPPGAPPRPGSPPRPSPEPVGVPGDRSTIPPAPGGRPTIPPAPGGRPTIPPAPGGRPTIPPAPGAPPGPPFPGPGEPVPARSRRRWMIAGLAAVAALAVTAVVLINAVGGTAGTGTPGGRTPAPGATAVTDVGRRIPLGSPLTDPQLVIPRPPTCGLTSYQGATPERGRFCVIDWTLINTGGELVPIGRTPPVLIDDRGTAHTPAPLTSELPSALIPGAKVDGELVYDLPPARNPAKLTVQVIEGGKKIEVKLS